MGDKQKIKELLELLSHLNHRQWESVKVIVDMAFGEKIKSEKVSFADVEDLICEDLLRDR